MMVEKKKASLSEENYDAIVELAEQFLSNKRYKDIMREILTSILKMNTITKEVLF
jgi:hypothetical protein